MARRPHRQGRPSSSLIIDVIEIAYYDGYECRVANAYARRFGPRLRPNGAGKTTFYHAHLKPAGLRFINADVLADELDMEPYAAAKVAATLRDSLVQQGESFVFETVFSDPVGDKVAFLKDAAARGYTVILCFIGISSPDVSEQRVAMRVTQGGHDVPTEKLLSRFPRTLSNLQKAIRELPHVWVFDNEDLREPYRKIAAFEGGRRVFTVKPLPKWLKQVLRETPGK